MYPPRFYHCRFHRSRLRHLLKAGTSIALVLALSTAASLRGEQVSTAQGTTVLRKIDVDLLDDISRRSFRYFWEQTAANTGLVLDRALTTGKPSPGNQPRIASIAATGFG